MPFHLLWRKDAPEGERALSQLRQEERWMPAIARIEQEAWTNASSDFWREGALM